MGINMLKKIILASASPRRRELLARIGLEFEVMPGESEEEITCSAPEDIVMELAERKAGEVFSKRQDQEKILVLGADTIVVHHGRVMGKPASEENAIDMLTRLCGDTHQVYTGVAFYWQEDGRISKHTFFECTEVSVYDASQEEIRAYAATKEPLDKAGAYGIQGRFAAFIKKINGDYNNVVGLPIGRVYQELKERGFCGCDKNDSV